MDQLSFARAALSALVMSLALTAGGPAVQARPLITSSEASTASLCRGFDDSYRRLVDICRDALSAPHLTAAERSELLTRLAEALWYLDEDGQAEAQYQAAIEANPRNVSAHTGLGWVYWYKDAYDRAAAAFRASVDLRPTAEGLAGLSSSRWYRREIGVAGAMELMDAALAISPDYAWALRERGWILFAAKRTDEAVASFEAAVERDPENWNGHYGLGRARNEQKDYEGALVAFGTAISIDPDMPWPYGERAYALRMLSRYKQAIIDADRMIERAPGESMGHTQKALSLEALGRRAAATEAFEAGIAAGAEDDFLFYWYAETLSNDGQYERAGDMIERAIEKAPSDPYNYELKAYIALMQDAYDASLAAADRALELDGGRVWAHYYAAAALVYAGRTDAGIARFHRAIEAGVGTDVIGRFAADLIAAGAVGEAIELRARY